MYMVRRPWCAFKLGPSVVVVHVQPQGFLLAFACWNWKAYLSCPHRTFDDEICTKHKHLLISLPHAHKNLSTLHSRNIEENCFIQENEVDDRNVPVLLFSPRQRYTWCQSDLTGPRPIKITKNYKYTIFSIIFHSKISDKYHSNQH